MKFCLKRPDRFLMLDVRMNHFGNVERDTADMKLLYLPPTAKKTMAIIQQFTLQFFPKFLSIEENTSTILE